MLNYAAVDDAYFVVSNDSIVRGDNSCSCRLLKMLMLIIQIIESIQAVIMQFMDIDIIILRLIILLLIMIQVRQD